MANSPPGPSSLESSDASFHEPNLEQLVEYLLASKRSLASTSLVWRARELVDNGREALEENAAVCAKNTFVRRALDEQVDCLEAIRYGTTAADAEGFEQFQATLESLDAASSRLQRTLESLRSTLVEPSLRPTGDPQKYLFDFVDDQGVATLEQSIKSSIDRFEDARARLAETCEVFEQDLARLNSNLLPETTNQEEDVRVSHHETPLPALVHQLETRATETASHLEGLVKHYDLCVKALKHTEGGGEAITQVSTEEEQEQSALAGLGVDFDKADAAAAQSISEVERLDLLNVIVKDAAEVDEVVAEIKDTIVDMEDSSGQIVAYVQGLRDTSARLRDAVSLLIDINAKLPIYINACAIFQAAWDEEKQLLLEKLDEMESLRDFYSGFEGAYDELLVEIQRRKQVRKDMEKVLRAAMADLDELYQEDMERRENFRENQGEFIPNDLWSGLVNEPSRFAIVQAEEEFPDEIPDIKKSVFEKAAKRVKDRAKPFKRAV